MLLTALKLGEPAIVVSVDNTTEVNATRLSELGFIEGEPVKVIRYGPSGSDTLVVQIGDTLIGLRKIEANCVAVSKG